MAAVSTFMQDRVGVHFDLETACMLPLTSPAANVAAEQKEENAMMTLKNVLVATDFSEAADVALTYGRTLAGRFGATLHVLYVAQDVYVTALGAESYALSIPDLQRQIEEATRQQLNELLIDSDNSGPRTVPAIVTAPSPSLAIIQYAKDHQIDLIVMGTHGRGALAHLVMGSVAERVVRLAPCPVLTVRHPEREFVRPDTPAVLAAATA
jgi:nucleotide-binding universal stress UspA family protein